jgi:hypothetical protein
VSLADFKKALNSTRDIELTVTGRKAAVRGPGDARSRTARLASTIPVPNGCRHSSWSGCGRPAVAFVCIRCGAQRAALLALEAVERSPDV